MRQSNGRVEEDQYLHVLTDTHPSYALCGGGLIIARVGLPFPLDDPAACPVCVGILRDSLAPEL